MAWNLYDYVDPNGVNQFKKWTESLQKSQLAKLNLKLDMLERNGPNLSPKLLSDVGHPPIQKLRIKSNVQLRPMLCRGPLNEQEYSLLIGAIEKGGKLIPATVITTALARRAEIIADPTRRCVHERISP